MLDINLQLKYDALDFEFSNISEYADLVESFLEREYHEHVELRPISDIIVSQSEMPSWSEDERQRYADHLNELRTEEHNDMHDRLKTYFPDLQRSTVLTAIVTTSEIWVRNICLNIQAGKKGKWIGPIVESSCTIGECMKALKKNGVQPKLSRDSLDRWLGIKEIRNLFVHQGGLLTELDDGVFAETTPKYDNKDQKRLLKAVHRELTEDNLSKIGNKISLNREFTTYAISVASSSLRILVDVAYAGGR